jgi:hypothetical protein
MGHREFRGLLRQLPPDLPAGADSPPVPTTPPAPVTPRSSTGWSRPLHAELAAAEAATVQAARARDCPGWLPEPRCVSRFADGLEVLKDGVELRLASFCLADAELRLAGADEQAAFATLKKQLSRRAGRPRRA